MRLSFLQDRLDKLTEEWDELAERKEKTEYVRYKDSKDGRNRGYFTIKSMIKIALMKEVLKGVQLFKEECECR